MSRELVWSIVANDFDDDDQGTTYCLIDDHGVPQALAPWPQMLEALAARAGARTERRTSVAITRERRS